MRLRSPAMSLSLTTCMPVCLVFAVMIPPPPTEWFRSGFRPGAMLAITGPSPTREDAPNVILPWRSMHLRKCPLPSRSAIERRESVRRASIIPFMLVSSVANVMALTVNAAFARKRTLVWLAMTLTMPPAELAANVTAQPRSRTRTTKRRIRTSPATPATIRRRLPRFYRIASSASLAMRISRRTTQPKIAVVPRATS